MSAAEKVTLHLGAVVRILQESGSGASDIGLLRVTAGGLIEVHRALVTAADDAPVLFPRSVADSVPELLEWWSSQLQSTAGEGERH